MEKMLEGITVLDFSRNLPGPFAGLQLHELGARVIKIENKKSPDPLSYFPPYVEEKSVYYAALNDGKEILLLDYTADNSEVLRLAGQADILLHSYRKGVMEKMGYDYAQISEINPAIIYVNISGYAYEQFFSNKAGHDLNYQAHSGTLYSLITSQSQAAPSPFLYADIFGGSMQSLQAIFLALYSRTRTGRGRYIEISICDGMRPLCLLQAIQNQLPKGGYEPWQQALTGGLCNYNVYTCADGQYIALGALEPKFWQGFCEWAKHPEWIPLPLMGEKGNVKGKQLLSHFFITKTRDEWAVLLEGTDYCISPVLRPEEIYKATDPKMTNFSVGASNFYRPENPILSALSQNQP